MVNSLIHTLASRGVVNKKNDNLQQWAIGADHRITNITQTDHSNTLKVHPFLKYAGGKGQLLPELDKLIPSKFNRYFEPFLGGGTFFFYLVSKGMKFNAYLSDARAELITTYRAIKNNPREIIERLRRLEYEYKKYPPDKKKEREQFYNQLKDDLNTSRSDVETAALFIIINKTCYNGLPRVNRKGESNTPIGYYKNPNICDSSNIENVSRVLGYSEVTILGDDYENVVKNAQKSDFVYLDPPYDPVNKNSFTEYTSKPFKHAEQVHLFKVFRKLSDRGCWVVLSNSDTPHIRELYSDSGFAITPIDTRRSINSNASKRKRKDLIISNYPPPVAPVEKTVPMVVV